MQVIQVWQLESSPFGEGTQKACTVIIDRICKSSSAVAWSTLSQGHYPVPLCAVRIVLQLYQVAKVWAYAGVLTSETAVILLLASEEQLPSSKGYLSQYVKLELVIWSRSVCVCYQFPSSPTIIPCSQHLRVGLQLWTCARSLMSSRPWVLMYIYIRRL